MTEVAIRDEAGAELAPVQPGRLVTWAMEARQAHQIAQSLAATSFVPKTMRGKPAEITAAILTGQELGLSPMSALRSIDIIEGTPALRAHALRGLVQAAGHEVWVAESTETRAIVCGRRRTGMGVAGPVYGEEQRSVWTIERAKKAGLTGKSNWQNHTQAMLVARATSELCRLIAADVLLGMPYSAEELGDDVPADDVPVKAAEPKTAKRTARRAPVEPAPVPEPEFDEPAPEPVAEAQTALVDDGWPEVAEPALDGES